ncbi:MAG: redoxin family protein [Planctomycetes bacterium]|nr:redoxin family protein [Planctomycetota bacterium]
MSIQIGSCRTWVAVAVMLAVGLVSGACSTNLAQEPDPPADKAEADKAEAGKAEADPYAVPDGTPEALANFIEKLGTQRPKGSTREEFIADLIKMRQAIVKAVDTLLAGETTGEQAATAITAKLGAMKLLAQFGDDGEKIAADMRKFIDSLKDDKRPEVVAVAKFYQFQQQVAKLKEHVRGVIVQGAKVDKKLIETIAKDLNDYLAGTKKLVQDHIRLVSDVAEMVEQMGEVDLAAGIYRSSGELLAKSDDKDIAGYGKKFVGVARRLGLIGNPIKVFGTLLDGTEVNWEDYQGKVVLVDYWATWCGPCIQELPNVLENYKRYHKHGFDVLAISLDGDAPGDRETVKKFIADRKIPWKTLFNDKPGTGGWEHPMVNYYGIMGIPSVILVDKQGKVISLNARGPELGELLAKHLGPVDDADDNDKKKEAEKKEAAGESKK